MAISRTYYEKKVRGGHITGLGTYWNHSWMHGKRTMKYKKRQFMATITQYGLSIRLRLYYKTTVIFRKKR